MGGGLFFWHKIRDVTVKWYGFGFWTKVYILSQKMSRSNVEKIDILILIFIFVVDD